ncbi:Cyclin-Y-like protein 2, partial [Durusdinium trenchii]
GIFSVSAFIVSVIYLSRFKESSRITLHACTWRPLFLTSLLLADKMWEDKPVRNSSLAKLFPVLSNVELNRMESQFLDEIKFNVLVKPDLFCSFCEKLLAEQVHQEISRCVIQSEYAVTLQAECVDSIPAKVPNGKPQAQAHCGPLRPLGRIGVHWPVEGKPYSTNRRWDNAIIRSDTVRIQAVSGQAGGGSFL